MKRGGNVVGIKDSSHNRKEKLHISNLQKLREINERLLMCQSDLSTKKEGIRKLEDEINYMKIGKAKIEVELERLG